MIIYQSYPICNPLSSPCLLPRSWQVHSYRVIVTRFHYKMEIKIKYMFSGYEVGTLSRQSQNTNNQIVLGHVYMKELLRIRYSGQYSNVTKEYFANVLNSSNNYGLEIWKVDTPENTIYAAQLAMALISSYKDLEIWDGIRWAMPQTVNQLLYHYLKYKENVTIDEIVEIYVKRGESIGSFYEFELNLDNDVNLIRKKKLLWELWNLWDPEIYEGGYGSLIAWTPREALDGIIELL